MTDDDLPNAAGDAGQAADQLVREWRRRIGRHGSAPEDELPALREALEAVGFTFDRLEHDAAERYLHLEYTAPDDVDAVDREVALLVTALRATHDSGEWARNGVAATNGTHTWELAYQWLGRWEPRHVVRRAIETLQDGDGDGTRP